MSIWVLIGLILCAGNAMAQQQILHPTGTHVFPDDVAVMGNISVSGSSGVTMDTLTVGTTVLPADTVVEVLPAADASTTGNGAVGDQLNIRSQTGQATTGTTGQTGGTGGGIRIQAGSGGSAPSGSTSGNGGDITLQAGAEGGGTGTDGLAGTIELNAGQILATAQAMRFLPNHAPGTCTEADGQLYYDDRLQQFCFCRGITGDPKWCRVADPSVCGTTANCGTTTTTSTSSTTTTTL